MNAKEVFEKEWSLYRSGAAQSPTTADGVRRIPKGEFDAGVKIGEVRIFADMKRPFVALIAEDCGLRGWRIVPVSPLTVPASAREMLVGERVLQLWNGCIASRRFVERSWRVDEITSADLKDVEERMRKVVPGRIVSGEGPLAEYERTFLVAGGNFVPLLDEAQKGVFKGAWHRYGAWGLAAMLMICFGATWLLYQEQLKSNEALRLDNIRRIKESSAYYEEECELPAVQEESESAPEELIEVEVAAAPDSPLSDMSVDSVAEARTVAPAAARYDDASRLIKSPVIMRCMAGSRSPGSIGCAVRSPEPESQPYGTERYAEYRENGFLDPKSEPLSTFSLDVDTSSYALMRRYLEDQKRLPPPNAVRLEEYVNYFRYNYAKPQGDDPIAVDCELAECPWNKTHKLLRLGVQAKRLEGDTMPPCNLTFLVDRSGSMGCNNGMELLKGGLKMLVSRLRAEDHVSIVTYAGGTEVLLRSTPGSDKKKIVDAIDSLQASGCTYGSAGIQLAYAEAERNFDKKTNNRVILVTDGDFNVGISSPRELEDFIASKRSSGVFLSVIGVGRGNYQDAMMKKLANAGNGNYSYLDSLLEAKKVMLNEIGGTLFTVAKDVKVQIEFNPSQVAGYRLLGYENRLLKAKDFNNDKKDAGEIGSGHSMTAFYELLPVGLKDKSAKDLYVDPLKYQKATAVESEELFTVKMRWKAPDGDKSKLKEIAKSAAAITRTEPSEDFRFASAVAEFALVLENSEFKGDASFEDVLRQARGAKGADEEGYRAEFIRLVERAELLKGVDNRQEPPSVRGQKWVDTPFEIEVDL